MVSGVQDDLLDGRCGGKWKEAPLLMAISRRWAATFILGGSISGYFLPVHSLQWPSLKTFRKALLEP